MQDKMSGQDSAIAFIIYEQVENLYKLYETKVTFDLIAS